MTYDGSYLRLYVNGVEDGSLAVSGSLITTTQPLLIGGSVPGPWNFPGRVDELALYNRALSSAEIKDIFAAGSAGKCATPQPPSITTQPADLTVTVGASASFSLGAAGSPPLNYQWSFNGTNLNGATASSLVLNNVQFADAGNYAVSVSNDFGGVTSSNALLTVNPAPPCAPPPAGLVSWWKAESNTLDQVGGNNGTLAGNTTYAAGESGQAFSFDGYADAVNLGNPASLRLQNFTIETWIKRANATRATQDPYNINGSIVCYGHLGYGFTLLNDGRLDITEVDVGGVFSSALRVTDTNFHHVALTKSGNTIVFYVDGVGETSGAYDPGFSFTTPVAIGARGDDRTTGFWGLIDEVAIYSRALSAGKIQSIYNASNSGKCATPVAPFIISQPASQT